MAQLTDEEKQVLKHMVDPGAVLLFNVKGMLQVRHLDEPYDFVGMGHESIERLEKKGLIEPSDESAQARVLQGQEWVLTDAGRDEAVRLRRQDESD